MSTISKAEGQRKLSQILSSKRKEVCKLKRGVVVSSVPCCPVLRRFCFLHTCVLLEPVSWLEQHCCLPCCVYLASLVQTPNAHWEKLSFVRRVRGSCALGPQTIQTNECVLLARKNFTPRPPSLIFVRRVLGFGRESQLADVTFGTTNQHAIEPLLPPLSRALAWVHSFHVRVGRTIAYGLTESGSRWPATRSAKRNAKRGKSLLPRQPNMAGTPYIYVLRHSALDLCVCVVALCCCSVPESFRMRTLPLLCCKCCRGVLVVLVVGRKSQHDGGRQRGYKLA